MTTTSRTFAPLDVSDQKLAVLNEISELGGTAFGLAQQLTIMTEGQGNCWIKTHKYDYDIDSTCSDDCQLNGVDATNAEIKQAGKQRTGAHEVWHVMKALETADLHIADDTKVMSPAVIFTQKNNKPGRWYIGDEFSAAGVDNLSFR